MMENLPENWNLVEEYEGNYIFEDAEKEFSVSIDQMGAMVPPYEISYQQLKGEFTKIGFDNGGYSTHAFNEKEALEKAVEIMELIHRKTLNE